MHQVCAQVQQWYVLGFPIKVAVNLSLYQFRQQNLTEMIRVVLDESGLEAEALELEVTESTLMDNEERVIRTLHELKDMGIRLAIDDFGTGYSSLSYLKRLPIETLKIDRSFVRDIPHDKEDVAITSAIISMANTLNLQLVAEGWKPTSRLNSSMPGAVGLSRAISTVPRCRLNGCRPCSRAASVSRCPATGRTFGPSFSPLPPESQ